MPGNTQTSPSFGLSWQHRCCYSNRLILCILQYSICKCCFLEPPGERFEKNHGRCQGTWASCLQHCSYSPAVFGVGRAGSPSRPVPGLHRHPPRAARRSAPTTFPCTYARAKHTRKSGRRSYTGERVSRRFDSQPSARAKKTANICRSFSFQSGRHSFSVPRVPLRFTLGLVLLRLRRICGKSRGTT